MKTSLLSLLVILGLTLPTFAEDWTFFSEVPKVDNKNYGVALIAGSSDLDAHDSSGDLYGVELSFIAPCVKASEHTIREQVSLTKFHKQDVDIYTLEANPHYLYQVESNTFFGIGPSIGLNIIDSNDLDDVALTLGVGASIHKVMTDKLFLGAEFRTVYATDRDVDNVRVIGKVGYFFDWN